ncbi:hypothetical protein BGW42_006041 [Actinomortierella wolfii]|nr:hypothetical protein BGW42_006041 [Actinomortierella wolfii]
MPMSQRARSCSLHQPKFSTPSSKPPSATSSPMRPLSSSRSQKIRYTSHIDARDGSNFQAQLRRPRYSYHIRFEPTTKYARPDVLVQYKHKCWKQPPDRPQEPESPPKAKTPIRAMLHNANKEQLLHALDFEHPTVIPDIGTLAANVKKAPAKQALVADVIRGAVRAAFKTVHLR